MPIRCLLVSMRERQNGWLGKRSTDDLKANGRPELVKPQGTVIGGSPETSNDQVLRVLLGSRLAFARLAPRIRPDQQQARVR
jgi:hypothetical protein